MMAVAPLAGARIETDDACLHPHPRRVAPLAGARIETAMLGRLAKGPESLPSRERELKHHAEPADNREPVVAPLAGARIETA